MKQRAVVIGLGLLALAMPRPAAANIMRWIDELSGPGPFKGYQYEWRIICGSDHSKGEADSRDERKVLLSIAGIGPCLIDRVPKGDRRTWSVNTSVGWFGTTRNPFGPDGGSDDERRVKLTTFELTVTWQATRGLDVGTGVGAYWFGGRSFDSFSRAVLIPARLDIRLAELIRRDIDTTCLWWTAMLGLRGDIVVVPRGFDAADFGASPNRFAPRDTLLTGSWLIDLEPLVRKIRKPSQPSNGGSERCKKPCRNKHGHTRSSDNRPLSKPLGLSGMDDSS